MRIYVPKDHAEFATMVVNHAQRAPDTRLGDLVLTAMVEGNLQAAVNADLYEQARAYSVPASKVVDEVIKNLAKSES